MKKKLVVVLAVLMCGTAYYFLIRKLGIAMPCMFRTLTGFKCPGCGLTHLAVNLIELNFRGAFEANRFLFTTSPFLVFEFIYLYLMERNNKLNTVAITVYLISFIAFGVIRNFTGW